MPSAYGEIYKWTDESGNVHFGDNPKNKEEATELIINIDSKTGVTHSSGRNKDRDYILKKREQERAEKAKKKKKFLAEKKKMKRKCLAASDRLKRYTRASSVFIVDKKGERRYYSSEERAKSEQRLRKSIKRYCSD